MCPGLIQPIRQSAEQRQFGAFLISARSPLRRAGKESGGGWAAVPDPHPIGNGTDFSVAYGVHAAVGGAIPVAARLRCHTAHVPFGGVLTSVDDHPRPMVVLRAGILRLPACEMG
jgi:hypothetical protein